ncbi:unnamed protein product, partial [Cuscuta europaea]
MFPKEESKISPTDVSAAMLNMKDGGDWFKRNFIVLMVSLLLESTQNGYVNPMIMNHLEDVDKIKDFDWCDHVLNCLIDSKVSWEKKKNKAFTGPLLFLMLFYVDRVVMYRRKVDRSLPIMKLWNGKLLRERELMEIESGGFGMGRCEGPFISEQCMQKDKPHGEGGSADRVEVQYTDGDNPEEFVKRFAQKTNLLAATVIDVLNMCEQAPTNLIEIEKFMKMQEA